MGRTCFMCHTIPRTQVFQRKPAKYKPTPTQNTQTRKSIDGLSLSSRKTEETMDTKKQDSDDNAFTKQKEEQGSSDEALKNIEEEFGQAMANFKKPQMEDCIKKIERRLKTYHEMTREEIITLAEMKTELKMTLRSLGPKMVVFRGATIDDIWTFQPKKHDDEKTKWKGCLEAIRRPKTPECYKNLGKAVTDNYDTFKHRVNHFTKKSRASTTSKVSEHSADSVATNVYNNENIFGYGISLVSRAHLLPRDAACAFFYGKIAECVVGVNLNGDMNETKKQKRQMLVYGVQESLQSVGEDRCAIQGLRDRANENLVVVPQSHDAFFDTLTAGNLVLLPIMTLESCKAWNQGEAYSLLAVGSNKVTYRWMHADQDWPQVGTASLQDLRTATTLAQTFMEGMLDTLLNDDLPTLEQEANGDIFKMDEIRDKHKKMEDMKNQMCNCNQNVQLPTIPNVLQDHEVLKIDLAKWTFQKYPDPFLVAIKGAINLFYHGSGTLQHKLLPACSILSDTDNSDNSLGSSLESELDGSVYNNVSTFPAADVSFVSDDADDVSVLSGLELVPAMVIPEKT